MYVDHKPGCSCGTEELCVLDADGHVIQGKGITRKEAEEQGFPQIYAVVFMVICGQLLLLCKRSKYKCKYPGRWDPGAVGLVRKDEDPTIASWRELEEELGMSERKTYFTKYNYRTLFLTPQNDGTPCFVLVSELHVDDPSVVQPNPKSIEEVAWVSPKDIEKFLGENELRPGVDAFLNRYTQRLLQEGAASP